MERDDDDIQVEYENGCREVTLGLEALAALVAAAPHAPGSDDQWLAQAAPWRPPLRMR